MQLNYTKERNDEVNERQKMKISETIKRENREKERERKKAVKEQRLELNGICTVLLFRRWLLTALQTIGRHCE